MGGKTAQSSSQIQIPPEVMAQYRAVNSRAEQAAAQPFQKYSDNPDAFVAPLTQTQQAGQQGINDAQGMYHPGFDAAQSMYGQSQGLYTNALAQEQGYQNAAGDLNVKGLSQEQDYQNAAGARTNAALTSGTGYINDAGAAGSSAAATGSNFLGNATKYALAGAQSVDPTALGAAQIGNFMSPYNQSVVQSTLANLRQQQGQEQSALAGNQVMSGTFGGSRANLSRANLARQQDLATGQVVSGLENQNYAQALAAAQQQQGVGLGAAQANRAALQQTGSALSNLGQQGYEQGMGLANLRSQLGQQTYGQQMGNAQELAALGVQGQSAIGQTADRAAALGQQGFGAISQTGQNLQALGGANAALSTQAFQNELAGRQAQIGAGTVEQQTQQAGLQAMYNQFLQQQGYPFQTAQFLAGIAGITGPNMGSSTYSTQPSSFFGSVLSDRRAKDDVEPIGETYDGQKIVRFRYKGRPQKEIGLIAQDVEKKHPLAVRKSGGMRYVDYARATDAAADRGHFAEGGSAMDIGDILAMHNSMYPFAAEMGSPHTGGGTGPHGVALMSMKPAKLLQADAPKIKEAGLHDAANTAQDIEALGKAGKGAYDSYQKITAPDASTLESNSSDAFNDAMSKLGDSGSSLSGSDITDDFRRGGVAFGRAARKDGGALPFSTDNSYVPEDVLDEDDLDSVSKIQARKSAAAQAPQYKDNGLQNAADIAKIASTIASFANRGGRIRKAEAGAVDDDAPDYSWENEAERQHPFNMSNVRKTIDAVNAAAGRSNPEDRYPGLSVPPTSRGVTGSWGDADSPALPTEKPRPPELPAAARPEALGAASPNIRPMPPMANKANLEQPARFSAADYDETPGADSQEGKAALAASSGQPGPKRDSWFGRNQDWLVPVLKGVGAMASSPSRYLGAAALQGLGAAAGSYEDVQNQLTTRGQQNIHTQAAAAQIAGDAFSSKLGAVRTYQNGQMVYVPWNKFYQDFLDGKKYQLAPLTDAEKREGAQETPAPPGGTAAPAAPARSAHPAAASVPPGVSEDLPDDEQKAASDYADKMVRTNPGFDMSRYANQPQMSPYADIKAQASASYSMDPQLKELSSALAGLSSKKVGGPISERLAELGVAVNDILSRAGVNYQVDPERLTDAQEIKKINGMLAQGAAAAGNQHAYAAIEQALTTVPSIINSPEGQRRLAADILVQQQRTRDLDNFATKWKDTVLQKTNRQDLANYSGEDIQNRFHSRYDGQYGDDHVKLEKMFDSAVEADGQRMPLFQYLMKYGNKISPARKQKLMDTFGPAALRYFNIR